MTRRANIFVNGHTQTPTGIKTLLELNDLDYVEIDVSGDDVLREQIFAKARERVLPIIELDGTYAGGTDIMRLAHSLKLKLIIFDFTVPQSCC